MCHVITKSIAFALVSESVILSRSHGSPYLASRKNSLRYLRVIVRNFIESRVSLFLSKHIPFVSSDFDRARRTSLVEIVKVSRDTMNYSYRGDVKLRETFLWRGESLLVYVCVYAKRVVVLVCRCRESRRGKKGQIAE